MKTYILSLRASLIIAPEDLSFHRIEEFGAEDGGGKRDRGADCLGRQPRVFGQDLFGRLPGRQLIEHQFHRDSRTCDGGLAHHDCGVGGDQCVW